jgi:hypothetical protein
VIDFEDLMEGDVLSSQYSGYGVTFYNGTILMAGSMLNEIDFPPHSGNNAVVNLENPVWIHFDSLPTASVGAWFTWVNPFQLTAYNSTLALLETVSVTEPSHFGTPVFVGLSRATSDIRWLAIVGDTPESFVMDDVTLGSPVPEPSPIVLICAPIAIIALARMSRWRLAFRLS